MIARSARMAWSMESGSGWPIKGAERVWRQGCPHLPTTAKTGQGEPVQVAAAARQPRQRGKLSRPSGSLGRLIQISHHAAGQCRPRAPSGDVTTARGRRRLADELLIAQLP